MVAIESWSVGRGGRGRADRAHLSHVRFHRRSVCAQACAGVPARTISKGAVAVEVAIKIQVPSLVQIPAEAVITRGMQPFVAVVDGESRLSFRPLHLADDDGETARVLDGLRAGETVALNVGESVEDGALVQAVERSGAAPSASKAPANRTAANERRALPK